MVVEYTTSLPVSYGDSDDDDTVTLIDESQTSGRRTFAQQLYKDVWDEFFTWEVQNNQHSISGLAATASIESRDFVLSQADLVADWDPTVIIWRGSYRSDLSVQARPQAAMDDEPAETWAISDYSTDGRVVDSVIVKPMTKNFRFHSMALPPHPRYHACSLASRSVLVPERWDSIKVTAFIPYADDPDFNVLTYLDWYDSFAWQTEFSDPDGLSCTYSVSIVLCTYRVRSR